MQFARIRKSRLDAGLPVAELAQAADRSLAWAYALERGLVRPDRPTAEKLALLFGEEVENLFEEVREVATDP